ncbi:MULTISPECIES: hypothetical protein [Chryseobacterium]|uniref:hypothetical protein n=1 Tax=Chryseobacterium TaxID=59732 RepID=UPI001295B901|nr:MULTISPECIES: hypothetical protein [Chryseobacterium]MDR6922965.1 hypothetical protein [Chryseobacterium sp. 2987]
MISLLLCVFLSLTAQTKEDLKKKYEDSDLNQKTEKTMKSQNVYPDSILLPPFTTLIPFTP